MKCIHYDATNPPREITLKSKKLVDGFYFSTDKGMITAATLFPIEFLPKLQAHWEQVVKARAELQRVIGGIYSIINEASDWRKA